MIFCVNLTVWTSLKEFVGGGSIHKVGTDESFQVALAVEYSFLAYACCAILCFTYAIIAFDQFFKICRPLTRNRLTKSFKIHIWVWASAFVIAILSHFVPVIGRPAMSPSGHYPNADWFHLPSFFFGLFIVMGPIPFSAYLFFKIFLTVKHMGIEGDLTKRTAKRLILHFVFFNACWTPAGERAKRASLYITYSKCKILCFM